MEALLRENPHPTDDEDPRLERQPLPVHRGTEHRAPATLALNPDRMRGRVRVLAEQRFHGDQENRRAEPTLEPVRLRTTPLAADAVA